MAAFTLTIPRASKLEVPIDFQWADDKTARDVSGNTADFVLHTATPVTVALEQHASTISRKLLKTLEATFPTATLKCDGEIVLKLDGVVVDRLFGKVTISGP